MATVPARASFLDRVRGRARHIRAAGPARRAVDRGRRGLAPPRHHGPGVGLRRDRGDRFAPGRGPVAAGRRAGQPAAGGDRRRGSSSLASTLGNVWCGLAVLAFAVAALLFPEGFDQVPVAAADDEGGTPVAARLAVGLAHAANTLGPGAGDGPRRRRRDPDRSGREHGIPLPLRRGQHLRRRRLPVRRRLRHPGRRPARRRAGRRRRHDRPVRGGAAAVPGDRDAVGRRWCSPWRARSASGWRPGCCRRRGRRRPDCGGSTPGSWPRRRSSLSCG